MSVFTTGNVISGATVAHVCTFGANTLGVSF